MAALLGVSGVNCLLEHPRSHQPVYERSHGKPATKNPQPGTKNHVHKLGQTLREGWQQKVESLQTHLGSTHNKSPLPP